MNGLRDTVPISVTSKALTQAFSLTEQARREEAIINKDFYYDKADKYVNKVTPEVDIATVNLVRVIAKKRTSLLYNQKLVREYDGPQDSIDFIESFYAEQDIDKFLLATDTMAELTGTGLVHIANDENTDSGLKLLLFDGSELSVVANEFDPNIADAISLIKVYDRVQQNKGMSSISVERVIQNQIWTQEKVDTYSSINVNSTPLLDSSITHELPVLPFVPFKGEDIEGQYIGHSSATSWRKLNATYNNLLTHLGYTIKMQSATPIVLTGWESGEGIKVHPGTAITCPSGATASVLNFNPKINDSLTTIKYIEDQIYNTSSVPKVTIVGGTASSGRELMIQWFPLLQVFKEKQVRFQRYELQLANTILALAELEPIVGIKVNYPEQSVLPFSAEEDNLDRDIKIGIKTPIDELMRRDPSLTEQEAEAIILANTEFNNSIIATSTEDSEDIDGSTTDDDSSETI